MKHSAVYTLVHGGQQETAEISRNRDNNYNKDTHINTQAHTQTSGVLEIYIQNIEIVFA